MAAGPIHTDAELAAAVLANTAPTTCPICASVDLDSGHKEPYVANLQGELAWPNGKRIVLHTEETPGRWVTTTVFQYPGV